MTGRDLFVATSFFNDGSQVAEDETDELALRCEREHSAGDVAHSRETDEHDHDATQLHSEQFADGQQDGVLTKKRKKRKQSI